MMSDYNPFAAAYPSSRGPIAKIFQPVIDLRTYLRAGHMLLMFPLGIAYFVFFVTTIAVGGALIWTFVGPVILLATLFISRWLGDLEAFTAAYVNDTTIRRPPSRLEGVSNFRSQVKVRLVDPTTWTGLVYLFAQFPTGIAAFVGIVTVYSFVGALTFAPLIVLFPDQQIVVGFWNITLDTPLEALALTPFGLLGFVIAPHMVLAFSSLHGWWARLMLGSRSARVAHKRSPAPAPAGSEPPRPSAAAKPETAAAGAVSEIARGAGKHERPAWPQSSPARAILTPAPDPSEFQPGAGVNTAAISELTAREREVFMLMAHGDTNADIAEELFISEGTVKTHVKRVLSKLDMRDRTQVVVFAYEQGIVIPRSAVEPQAQRSYSAG